METARNSRIKIDLAQLFEQQVEFFRRRTLGETTPAEQRDYEKRRERIRQLFAELGRSTTTESRGPRQETAPVLSHGNAPLQFVQSQGRDEAG